MNTDQHRLNSTKRQDRQAACDTTTVPPASCGPRRALFSRSHTLHYKVLFASWFMLVLLQFLFPGFEARGLFAGQIIGLWAMALVQVPMEFPYEHTLAALIIMTVICALLVLLCGWLMGKAKFGRKFWIPFAILVFTGGLVSSGRGSRYGEWQRSAIIQQAENSPEVNYQPTRRDYNRTILIPRTIAGCLWGFYAASGLCALPALVKITRKAAHCNRNHGGDVTR